jgi:hypothetical protein
MQNAIPSYTKLWIQQRGATIAGTFITFIADREFDYRTTSI